MVETEASATLPLQSEDWTQTPWRTLERHVYRLQKRISKAQQRGNVKAVHSLQRLLMKSRAARTLAVRRVTQDNQGRRTAGIDGVKAVGPLIRLLFVERLRTPAAITAQPVRRVLIPKAGKPDRAHQTLARLALEPQWEARFEPNSYGFRPGRSCHDALLAVPAIRRAVKAWLKAGVLAEGAFVATPSGVPQGGAISPLLANVALHGLEEIATHAYRRRNTGLRLIRYADDFVVQRGAKWQFATRDGYRLRAHQDTAIKRHVKVCGNASPYDGNLTYWSRRLTDHVMFSSTRGWLLARQKGLCPFCGLTFREDDVLDLDHIVPLAHGGRDESSNQQLLHRHCHDQKTARDGSTTRVGVGSR
jgi:retron-type reverse transcriptase